MQLAENTDHKAAEKFLHKMYEFNGWLYHWGMTLSESIDNRSIVRVIENGFEPETLPILTDEEFHDQLRLFKKAAEAVARKTPRFEEGS